MSANVSNTEPVAPGKFWRNSNHAASMPRTFRLSEFLHLTEALASELLRTLWSLIFFLLAGFIVTFNIQWSDERWKHSEKDMEPLVDLGFKILPETDKVYLSDLFMLTLFAGSIVFTLFTAETHLARIIIARRILWILGLLLLFRGITLSVTTLPSPKNCTPVHTGSFLFMIGQSISLITGSTKACTDNIFSGHATFITTSVILFRIYCKYPLLKYYSYAHGFTGACLLIATRIHYTVDVILAVFITYAVHSIYYFIVDLCIEKHFLHIRRAEERLGDKSLYQRIAYTPNMFNTSLVGIVRWMDGLDIRFSTEGEHTVEQTVELAHQRQEALVGTRQSPLTPSSTTENDHVIIMANDS